VVCYVAEVLQGAVSLFWLVFFADGILSVTDEIARLKAKVGEITMANELLYAKIDALENKRPLARRRPRK